MRILLCGFFFLSFVGQTSAWKWSLVNWSGKRMWGLGHYAICRDDVHPKQMIPKELLAKMTKAEITQEEKEQRRRLSSVADFDASECLLKKTIIKEAYTNIPGKSYESSIGQRVYKQFYIINFKGVPTVFRKANNQS